MVKTEKVQFSEAVVLSDIKMNLKSTPRNSRGQFHFVTLAKGHLFVICLHFQRTSPLKLQFNFSCSKRLRTMKISSSKR